MDYGGELTGITPPEKQSEWIAASLSLPTIFDYAISARTQFKQAPRTPAAFLWLAPVVRTSIFQFVIWKFVDLICHSISKLD